MKLSAHRLGFGWNARLVLAGVLLLLADGPALWAQDDGPGNVQFTTNAVTVDQSAGVVNLTVVNTDEAACPITVEFATQDGTATAPLMYTANSGTLPFGPAFCQVGPAFIQITLGTGTPPGTSTYFTVVLSNPVNAPLGANSTVTVTITNAGSPPPPPPTPPTVQFSPSAYTVNEADGSVQITVTLTATASAPVSVNYETADGTAVAGTDYAPAYGTVTFPAGVTSQTFTIGIIDNGNYTDQTLSFTVTLSGPSSNAVLGSPTVATIDILDDDLPPVGGIVIKGVKKGDQKNPGGYVQVNANNDNGSQLTYADGVTAVTAGTYGIPKMRDFDPKNVKLQNADPDLLQINLSATNVTTETIALSVSVVNGGRAKIQIWDTATKQTLIATPTSWTKANMPASVFVEGLLEGAALKEVTLTMQILNGNVVVSSDTCSLTVTPVLTNLVVTVNPDTAPGFGRQFGLGPIIESGKTKDGKATAFTTKAAAQWDQVDGKLRFIQTAKFVNNLKGGFGAENADGGVKYDFAAPNAGKALVDSKGQSEVPFYTAGEKVPNATSGNVTNSVNDTPVLPLDLGVPVIPAVGAKGNKIDVTYSYVMHGVVAFTDKSIYCIGQQAWNVRFNGIVTKPSMVDVGFIPGAQNANNGSGPFAASVRNNANPAAIGRTFGNDADAKWRR